MELVGKATGELVERHAHLHAHTELPPDVEMEARQSLTDLIMQLEELEKSVRPYLEAELNKHILEGEAALPPAAIADVPRR